MFVEEKSSSQGVLSIFSLQVSFRLSITSCYHVANYVSIVWAQRKEKRKRKERKELTLSSSYVPLIEFFVYKISLSCPHLSYTGDSVDKEMRLMYRKGESLANTSDGRVRAGLPRQSASTAQSHNHCAIQ